MTFKELEVGDVAYNRVIRRFILKLSDRRYFDLDRKKVCGFPPDCTLNNEIYIKASLEVKKNEID
jgi:hypothetical protein